MRRIMIHRDKPACARLTQQRTRVSTRLHNCDRWSLDFHNTPANRPGKQRCSSNLWFFFISKIHARIKIWPDYSIKIISIFHKYVSFVDLATYSRSNKNFVLNFYLNIYYYTYIYEINPVEIRYNYYIINIYNINNI